MGEFTKAQIAKSRLKEMRDKAADAKSEDELVKELGEGVEADPIEPDKPEEDFPLLDLQGAQDVRHIVDELKQLPELKDVNTQMTKMDAYESYAKKIWIHKMSDQETFPINLRKIEKTENKKRGNTQIEYIHWKRDENGNYEFEPKIFKFSSITIQDKDEINWLASEKDVAYFTMLEEGARIRKLINNPASTDKEFSDYVGTRTWQSKQDAWEKTVQDYWIAVFKIYYNATDDDVKRMHFDDIVNYGEVALYKGGVKSPKYVGS